MPFYVDKPGKKIKEICNKLGEPYKVRVFDLRNVIYRDLGNGYDFEIAGLDNQEQNFEADFYIQETGSQPHIVEKIIGISSFEKLTEELDKALEKYLD